MGAGGKAEEVGGPLDKDGKVGHQFTTDGAVGKLPAQCTLRSLHLRAYLLNNQACSCARAGIRWCV